MASVSIYNHLAEKHGGLLGREAAEEGLAIYAEVVEDARLHPGSHPNIDILINAIKSGKVLKVVVERGGK